LKKGFPEYYQVHSQVLQDVLRRVDRAFANFFDRVGRRKKGQRLKVGYPRFKPSWRYDSITYPQAQNLNIIDGHIILPKIGKPRVFMHRDLIGEIKTATVKRDAAGDWHIILTCESPDIQQHVPQSAIGVDVGLLKLVQASNGEFVKAQKFYQKSEDGMKLAQRRLARKAKGSKNRVKEKLRLAKIHRKIRRQRDDFLHKVSKELVSRADLLVFEDLTISNMVKNHKLAKSIYDSSRGKLYEYAFYKASSAGKSAVRVDPRGTTCNCGCGNKVKLSLGDRVFHCPKCGLTIDRDFHASFSILRKVGWETAELTPVEMRPLLAEPAGRVVEAGSPER